MISLQSKLWEKENCKNLYLYCTIRTYLRVILEEGFANQHQSAACNMVEIGCILSKDCNLSSVVCTCNSRHVLRGPGVKQAD